MDILKGSESLLRISGDKWLEGNLTGCIPMGSHSESSQLAILCMKPRFGMWIIQVKRIRKFVEEIWGQVARGKSDSVCMVSNEQPFCMNPLWPFSLWSHILVLKRIRKFIDHFEMVRPITGVLLKTCLCSSPLMSLSISFEVGRSIITFKMLKIVNFLKHINFCTYSQAIPILGKHDYYLIHEVMFA